MAIKKLKPRSPSRNLGKTIGDNTLATIADVNQLVDQINKSVSYKVYTALLTQSGGDDPQGQSAGNTIIGVTYTIGNNGGAPGDWTNIGAPNNNVGTSFIATGTIPADWGDGFLDRNGGAPVVTVLENTIGNIYWTYNSVGFYYADLSFLNPEDTTLIQTFVTVVMGTQNSDIAGINGYVRYAFIDGNGRLYISTYDYDTNNNSNSVLTLSPIEIRVYN